MGMRFDRAGLLRRVAAVIGPARGHLFAACEMADETPVCRSRLCLATARWMVGLPTLGDVLYLPGRLDRSPRQAGLPGMLVESIELAPLLQVRTLVAAGAITPDGPREWIECLGDRGRVMARLYLLPDTDYLAWDALHAPILPAGEQSPRTDMASWHPASARLLRFRVRQLAGLQILGADLGTDASPLGRELAARIARDEVLAR
jgi:hypothetical protein